MLASTSRGRLPAWLAVAILAAYLLAQPTTARAEGEPAGRFGIVTAFRANTGALGKDYAGGFLWGFEAGYHPPRLDDLWSLGIGWTTLVRGYYFFADEALVDRTVQVTEMSLGLRLRRRVGAGFLLGTAGGMVSRSSIPIEPDDKRSYLGTYGGLGFERLLGSAGFLGAELRYSMLPNGPRSLTFLISFTAGLSR